MSSSRSIEGELRSRGPGRAGVYERGGKSPLCGVLLYDGDCPLCRAGSARLVSLAPRGTVERVNFREAGVLERFAGVDEASCERAMQFVEDGGRVSEGVRAAARLLAGRWWALPIVQVVYVPVIGRLLDRAYDLLARHRFRVSELLGLDRAAVCEDGACALHGEKRAPSASSGR